MLATCGAILRFVRPVGLHPPMTPRLLDMVRGRAQVNTTLGSIG
jgi:hypothetical protein